MNIKQLQERQAQIQEQFETHAARQKEIMDEHAAVEQEKLRLQGEHRLVQELIEKANTTEGKPKRKAKNIA